MSTKSTIAARFSLRSIQNPHLWTFTTRETEPIKVTAKRWQKLQRDLVRSLGMYGVRVFELHPGGHGLHIHLVVSGRYDVRDVRAITEKHGFGRIHVVRTTSPEYVVKYLTKQKREPCLKGLRLWSKIGTSASWCGSKVKDIVFDSNAARLYQSIRVVNKPISFQEHAKIWRQCELVSLGLGQWVYSEGQPAVDYGKGIILGGSASRYSFSRV